ncbi:hypothetical protein Cme02nite_71040 [Catellatospora methionotrophica]|uniref:Uncharacterized protein n=1 Tax=Catellatospora methionotrophica TaxID=121620 RepID=A0A8J3LG86_9ACTN|nr:hypothetical protein Cme02nite_71040 [Catellatospora methionotrophica]
MTWTHGSMRSSHRDEISCIWGADFVVVARLRAAAVARLDRACPLSTSAEESTDTTITHFW